MTINELLKYTVKPKIFERGTSEFWTDPYISMGMLEAHLNPNWDAASRKPKTIDKTVKWINDNFLHKPSLILDLGCGPGLYAEGLARLGHDVIGMDFSKSSIEYAREASEKQNIRNTEYIYQNYLEIDYHEKFDLIILIYCDFGALSNESRDALLKKIYNALKSGGYFIFDVFTEAFELSKQVKKDWDVSKASFWNKDDHLVLSEVFHYPEEKTFLNQDIVITESSNFEVYRSYDHYYSVEDLVKLLDENKFNNHSFHYDIIEDSNYASNNVVFTATQK